MTENDDKNMNINVNLLHIATFESGSGQPRTPRPPESLDSMVVIPRLTKTLWRKGGSVSKARAGCRYVCKRETEPRLEVCPIWD